MTVKEIQLEKVSLSDMQNLRTVCKTLTADKKYSLLNRDNLLLDNQLELSQKEKQFSPYFFAFWKPRFNFEHFQKKGTLLADAFLNLQTPKNVVR